jgi:sarcosine oxidase delta subunit
MKRFRLLLLTLLLLAACTPSPEQQAANTDTAQTATAAAWTSTPSPSSTPIPTLTFTPLPTFTPTDTFTPTPSLTPSATPTPTRSLPAFTVNKQAYCRYGPSKAYLPAADLYAGDTGQVWGRAPYGSTWLYVKPDKINYQCWVAPSVVDVTGDTSTLWINSNFYTPGPSALYGPPANVRATRNGDQVTITWDSVYMTVDDDRGYFIEAWVCQNGAYIWYTVGFGTLTDQYKTTYTLTDQAGCSLPSSGKLYTVEKHGYTTPADIPWPPP